MRQWVGNRSARVLSLGLPTLVVATAVAVLGAPAALASGLVTPPPPATPSPNEDASCETRPTTYPADGSPIAAEATCVLIDDAAGMAVGETWTWQDDDSVQWYNYAAAGVPTADGTVMMCGTTANAATTSYTCTDNSTYLLFAVDGVFVEWPTAAIGDLHFCQSVSFGAGLDAVAGGACATVTSKATGPVPPAAEGSVPAPLPTVTPVAPVVPTPAPSTEPTQTASGDAPPAGSGDAEATPSTAEPTDEGAGDGTAGTTPTTTTPEVVAPAASATSRPGDPGSATQTPIATESIAVVGGSRFPMLMILVLAAGLALGGYVALAGPGLLAARRRRR